MDLLGKNLDIGEDGESEEELEEKDRDFRLDIRILRSCWNRVKIYVLLVCICGLDHRTRGLWKLQGLVARYSG